jgi:hypothetical protein
MTSIHLALEIIRLRPGIDDLSDIDCPDCHAPMIIHQPDESLPDRLIGICDSCTGWFLIEAAAGLIVRLPDDEALRDA